MFPLACMLTPEIVRFEFIFTFPSEITCTPYRKMLELVPTGMSLSLTAAPETSLGARGAR